MGSLYVIDRFEDNTAVLEKEDGSHIDVPGDRVPNGAHEGDVLEQAENGFIIRHDLTAGRRKKIQEKQKKLFRHRSDED